MNYNLGQDITRTSFNVEDRVLDALRMEASKKHTSMSKCLNDILRDYFWG